jgi:hypothetical protein
VLPDGDQGARGDDEAAHAELVRRGPALRRARHKRRAFCRLHGTAPDKLRRGRQHAVPGRTRSSRAAVVDKAPRLDKVAPTYAPRQLLASLCASQAERSRGRVPKIRGWSSRYWCRKSRVLCGLSLRSDRSAGSVLRYDRSAGTARSPFLSFSIQDEATSASALARSLNVLREARESEGVLAKVTVWRTEVAPRAVARAAWPRRA